MGGDADDNADEIMVPARTGHRGDTGRVQPPPPTVLSVRHAGAVVFPERATLEHSTVQEGVGAEATALGRELEKGGQLNIFQCLWTPPWDDDLLQIPGESDIGGG